MNLGQYNQPGFKGFTLKFTLIAFFAFCPHLAQTEGVGAKETIVLIRHAEKPNAGLGQLSCQGLNRAMALPEILIKKFGNPAAIFAPNPSIEKEDKGIQYAYIRPLATIEPTAIRLGLPVNVQLGFNDVAQLKQTLTNPIFKNAIVFVAWEHRLISEIAKDLLLDFHVSPEIVPVWERDDFDSIYIITISEDSRGNKTASFKIDAEGLNKLSGTCP